MAKRIPSSSENPISGTHVGKLLRTYRRAAGMTQRQLAAASKVSLGSVRDLEQGRTEWPRWASIEALAEALELDPRRRRRLTQLLDSRGRDRPPGKTDPASTPPNDTVQIGILGPTIATRSGAALALGPKRQRAVLAILALRPNQPVHVSELTDALWPAEQPMSATIIIQGYVSRLRHILEPRLSPRSRGRFISWAGDAYCLETSEACELDIELFHRYAQAGHDALTSGDTAQACQRYDDAISLCRGRTLADVDLLWEHPVVAATEAARSDVILRYSGITAPPASQEKAMQHLRTLCAVQEYNEPAFARLITIMGKAGQKAAAVLLFKSLRERLHRELGIHPSEQVTDAYQRLLKADDSLPPEA
jgi:DNA-binding SARP family transcriptional activator/DNA-binding XRE family transcriptional regulator